MRFTSFSSISSIVLQFEKVKKTSRKGGKDTNEKGRKRKLRSEDGEKDGYREFDDMNKPTSDNEGTTEFHVTIIA